MSNKHPWPLPSDEWIAYLATLMRDKETFKDLYMQQPVVTGFDLAAPDGEFTVRWNSEKGYHERRMAGGSRWERCS